MEHWRYLRAKLGMMKDVATTPVTLLHVQQLEQLKDQSPQTHRERHKLPDLGRYGELFGSAGATIPVAPSIRDGIYNEEALASSHQTQERKMLFPKEVQQSLDMH